MRKDVIYAVPRYRDKPQLIFYYRNGAKKEYLFTSQYKRSAYLYFRNGKSPGQLLRDKHWHNNHVLSNLIEGQLHKTMMDIQRG